MGEAAAAVDLKNPDLYAAGVPWDEFARLRRDDPVHWNPETDGAGFWALTRQADIVEVSRNPALFSSAHEHGGHRIFNENEVGLTNAGESAIGIPFISLDPPEHTRYRKVIMPALSPVRIESIEQRIRSRATALIDAIPLGEPIDLVQTLSAPLPLMTLAELLAVDGAMWTNLYHWTNAFVGEDDPDFRQSPEAMQQTLGAFMGFVSELYRVRLETPGNDIASLLASTGRDGEGATLGEFIANMILVLVGGNETTRNSLSHTVHTFAHNPGEWERLRSDRELLATAPAEMVRHASPVMHMRRTATRDTEIAGQPIARGDKVVLLYIAANRDEAAFDDADRFDIARNARGHVGFGTGQHVCVGSRLAEMQLRVAFGLLADRVSAFELVTEPRRFRSNFINGIKTLDVVLHPA